MFHCCNCGETDDGIGDGHGNCPMCGAFLQFNAQRELTGIEKHFAGFCRDARTADRGRGSSFDSSSRAPQI